ncbi:hypothetical protein OR573_07015 [Halomonas sp. CH40]
MQAPRFLHNWLTSALPSIHAKRLQALLDTVSALLTDRLLGNHHLHEERPLFYWLVTNVLIGHMTRSLILVEWLPSTGNECRSKKVFAMSKAPVRAGFWYALIAMLANMAMMVAGLGVITRGQQKHYQSNSIDHRNVLSVWRLGLEWLRRQPSGAVPWLCWVSLQESLREEARHQALCDA